MYSSSSQLTRCILKMKLIVEDRAVRKIPGKSANPETEENATAVVPKDYFVSVHPLVTLVIFVGLFVLVQMAAWRPQLLDHLGDFGETLHREYSQEIRTFFLVCLAIHIFEGMVGFAIAGMFTPRPR